MYADMEWWTKIRQKVLVEGVSKRQVLQETGIHWKTLEKILGHSSPPGYRLPQSGAGGYSRFSESLLGCLSETPKNDEQ